MTVWLINKLSETDLDWSLDKIEEHIEKRKEEGSCNYQYFKDINGKSLTSHFINGLCMALESECLGRQHSKILNVYAIMLKYDGLSECKNFKDFQYDQKIVKNFIDSSNNQSGTHRQYAIISSMMQSKWKSKKPDSKEWKRHLIRGICSMFNDLVKICNFIESEENKKAARTKTPLENCKMLFAEKIEEFANGELCPITEDGYSPDNLNHERSTVIKILEQCRNIFYADMDKRFQNFEGYCHLTVSKIVQLRMQILRSSFEEVISREISCAIQNYYSSSDVQTYMYFRQRTKKYCNQKLRLALDISKRGIQDLILSNSQILNAPVKVEEEEEDTEEEASKDQVQVQNDSSVADGTSEENPDSQFDKMVEYSVSHTKIMLQKIGKAFVKKFCEERKWIEKPKTEHSVKFEELKSSEAWCKDVGHYVTLKIEAIRKTFEETVEETITNFLCEKLRATKCTGATTSNDLCREVEKLANNTAEKYREINKTSKIFKMQVMLINQKIEEARQDPTQIQPQQPSASSTLPPNCQYAEVSFKIPDGFIEVGTVMRSLPVPILKPSNP